MCTGRSADAQGQADRFRPGECADKVSLGQQHSCMTWPGRHLSPYAKGARLDSAIRGDADALADDLAEWGCAGVALWR